MKVGTVDPIIRYIIVPLQNLPLCTSGLLVGVIPLKHGTFRFDGDPWASKPHLRSNRLDLGPTWMPASTPPVTEEDSAMFTWQLAGVG